MYADWMPPADRPLEEADVPEAALAGKTVAVIGYGTMGRAHALNLRDSGVAVVVGARPESRRGDLARSELFSVMDVAAATSAADVVMLMLPDEAMKSVWTEAVEPHLQAHATVGFAHGFAVAFDQIDPGDQACFLAAPKGQGDMLREAYLQDSGVPGLLAVTESSPPGTWAIAAAYARAVGCLKGGGWRTTFRDECVADQFGEQTVLCGGVIELLQAAFDTLTARGYDQANAYFECVHELKLITDLLHRYGIDGMRRRISPTAAYGGLSRGPRLIDAGVRDRMHAMLDEIEDGRFAGEFLERHDDPDAGTRALADHEAATPLAAAGRALQARLASLSSDQRTNDSVTREGDPQ